MLLFKVLGEARKLHKPIWLLDGHPENTWSFFSLCIHSAFVAPSGMLTIVWKGPAALLGSTAGKGRPAGGRWNRWDTLEPLVVLGPRNWYEQTWDPGFMQVQHASSLGH